MKKTISIAIAIAVLGLTNLYAKQDKEHKGKKIPYGLQKKINNGGTLPPGWQKKLHKGEVVDGRVLENSKVIHSKEYPDIKDTTVYQTEDKVFRVINNTKEIMEILK